MLASVAVIVATSASDVSAQSPEETDKTSYDQIMESVDSIEEKQLEIERIRFYREHGYAQEARKNVRVNFASHFGSGEAITQSMYEVGASMAKKSSAPQVVILIVRDPEEALTLRSGNRFSNTDYEQKVIDMARNVSNSFEDPQAKVLLTLAIAQEDGINTRPGDILFYINDRVDHFSPTGDNYKDLDEDQFIRDIALSLGYQFDTGRYRLTEAQLAEGLHSKDEGRVTRDTSGSSSGDTGSSGDAGSSDKAVRPPIIADNSM